MLFSRAYLLKRAELDSESLDRLSDPRIAQYFELLRAFGRIDRFEVDACGRVTAQFRDPWRQRFQNANQALDGDPSRDGRAIGVSTVKVAAVPDAGIASTHRDRQLMRARLNDRAHRLAQVHVLMRVDVGRIAAHQQADRRELREDIQRYRYRA